MNKTSIIGSILFVLALSGSIFTQNPLYIPPVLNGPVYHLEMQHGTHTFFPGLPSNTMGFNGNILGPTLILNKGTHIDISVLNSIGEETTVHWHGLHVSPENDGGPHSIIDPNSSYDPSFEVLDKAATYWYHPHLHEHTAKHVSLGLAGMIIVRDSEEATLNLPRQYGVDDFPIILQTKSIDPVTGQIRYSEGPSQNSNPDKAPHGDSIIMVNATVHPYLAVPKQVVRLRLLNGANHRVYNLGLSDNSFFYQIASDGGLLQSPYSTNRLRLSPGERAEILIDFDAYIVGNTVKLKSYASELPDGIWGASEFNLGASSGPYHPNPLNGNDFDFMEFRIINATGQGVSTIPQSLVNVTPIPEGQANNTRVKYLTASGSQGPKIGPNPLSVDNDLFDINVVNDVIDYGAIEIWELHGDPQQSHTFHIHDVQFYILDRTPSGGSPALPPINERGRKDVILIEPGEIVRFIAKFDDFASEEVPYMYHCHFLTHEDRGMMGQFIVKHEIYVDKNHIGIENGSNTFPYDTFKEAIDAAVDGSTIIFKSGGDHNEIPPDLLISKPIILRFQNGPITIK